MLIVADQTPVRIRGQGRLAGAGKPEEQRHVAASPRFAEQCIGRTSFSGSR